MDDEKIVELFLERDEGAIAAASEKYGPAIRKIAFNILGDDGYAEECESDTFLAAWNSIPPHEPRGYLFSYLARIARSSATDRLRKQSAEKRNAQVSEFTLEMQECIPGPEDVWDKISGMELSKAISSFLQSQSKLKRGIFLRRYWYMDSIADIARRVGMSEGKVKTVLFRMRLKLREYLKKEGFDL